MMTKVGIFVSGQHKGENKFKHLFKAGGSRNGFECSHGNGGLVVVLMDTYIVIDPKYNSDISISFFGELYPCVPSEIYFAAVAPGPI